MSRILVIEDDVDTCDALALLLSSWGHELETANDAETGISKAEEFHPHVLICDWMLSNGRDGISAAQAIQGDLGIPVIFVTAHSVPELRSRTKNLRVHAYLPKPIDVGRLTSMLAALG